MYTHHPVGHSLHLYDTTYVSFILHIMPTQFLTPFLVVQLVISSSTPSRIPIFQSLVDTVIFLLSIMSASRSQPLPVMNPIFTGPSPNAQHHTPTCLCCPVPLDALSNRTGPCWPTVSEAVVCDLCLDLRPIFNYTSCRRRFAPRHLGSVFCALFGNGAV